MAGNSVDRPPTDRELAEVSRNVGTNFKILGVNLGLDSVKIDHAVMNNPMNAQCQIFQMLVSWRNKMAKSATVSSLIEAVRNTGDIDIEAIERIFNL